MGADFGGSEPVYAIGDAVITSATGIYNGGAGVETGWAMPDDSSAESHLAAAGGISGGGPFPTKVGLNFDDLL